jgi:hypothetical protein
MRNYEAKIISLESWETAGMSPLPLVRDWEFYDTEPVEGELTLP